MKLIGGSSLVGKLADDSRDPKSAARLAAAAAEAVHHAHQRGMAVRSVDVSRDGGLIASGSDDGTIVLRSAATGRFMATLEEGSVPIREIRLRARGRPARGA